MKTSRAGNPHLDRYNVIVQARNKHIYLPSTRFRSCSVFVFRMETASETGRIDFDHVSSALKQSAVGEGTAVADAVRWFSGTRPRAVRVCKPYPPQTE